MLFKLHLIRCNFPDISYLSETQKKYFQFLTSRRICLIIEDKNCNFYYAFCGGLSSTEPGVLFVCFLLLLLFFFFFFFMSWSTEDSAAVVLFNVPCDGATGRLGGAGSTRGP